MLPVVESLLYVAPMSISHAFPLCCVYISRAGDVLIGPDQPCARLLLLLLLLSGRRGRAQYTREGSIYLELGVGAEEEDINRLQLLDVAVSFKLLAHLCSDLRDGHA